MDELTEKMIRSGLQPVVTAAPPGETVPMSGPDGVVQQVPVLSAIFMAIDQQLLELRQIGLRLDGLHHHMAAREHAKSQVHKTCPVCVAISKAVEMAMEQVKQQAEQEVAQVLGEQGVSTNPDPEGDVKADFEKAAAAMEESQVENE